MPTLHRFPTVAAWAEAAAAFVAEHLATAIRLRGAASLVLTGGSAPGPVYAHLATTYATALDWGRVALFWGDERSVPPDHPDSNYRQAFGVLIGPLRAANPAFLPEVNVFRMAGEQPPVVAADTYEAHVRAFLAVWQRFDVTLLGMGPDGHINSLFPGSPLLDEAARLVCPAVAPPTSPITDRVTLTLPAVAASDVVVFLVTGAAKQPAVCAALDGAPSPAGRVTAPDIHWFLDDDAAPTV